MHRLVHARRTPSPGRRRALARPLVALAAASLAADLLVIGCSTVESVCSGDEYPVLAVNNTGSACVPDNEQPPQGYTRYPEGKEPQHVGDKWDTFWQTHTVDEKGTVIEAPDPAG